MLFFLHVSGGTFRYNTIVDKKRSKAKFKLQGLVAAKVFPMSMTNLYLTSALANLSIAVFT
uniref:Putative mannitol dehydrogenase n=1 Tax=Rhizophora mucronata TaxID=61149 RepID=A0A2P2LTI5_RHIMU